MAILFLKGPLDSLENFQYYVADEKEINAFLAAAPGESTLCFLQLFRPFADEKEINAFLGLEAISYTGWEPTQSTRVRRAWRRPHHLREKSAHQASAVTQLG